MVARRVRDRDRGGNRNAIRGPQSALTDFLAANNISAYQIRLDYEQRLREAEQRAGTGAAANGVPPPPPPPGYSQPLDEEQEDEDDDDEQAVAESSANAKKRRKQAAAIRKIKESKKFKKAKKSLKGEPGEDDDEDIAWDLYEKAKPLPGQLDNCEECGKRFTVTPYSKEGPQGGLLCVKCSKAQDAEKKKIAQNKKGRIQRENRRQRESEMLNGEKPQGTKSLKELCVAKVTENIDDVDEFGSLPHSLLDRLSQSLSKRRLLNSSTLDLFLEPGIESLSIYDCGKLENQDFIKMLQIGTRLKSLTLEHAGQIKDNVIDFLLERDIPIESLKLEATNLVTNEKWREFFDKKGRQLRALKLTWLDFAMDDETLNHLVDGCPNLTYLKLKRCFKLTDSSILKIAQLKNLQHLHLRFPETIRVSAVVTLISSVGAKLQSLTLDSLSLDQSRSETEGNGTGPEIDPLAGGINPDFIQYMDTVADPKADNVDEADEILRTIHTHCTRLTKLRITDSDQFTDQGLAALFNNWANPALSYINFSKLRSWESATTEAHEDAEYTENAGATSQTHYGVGPAAFPALMRHSGTRLERLIVDSCRHITHGALLEAFAVDEPDGTASGAAINGATKRGPARYPVLKDADMSFVGGVDTAVVASIFKCAPRIERLAVFGCFGVRDVLVPPYVALIGVPNAQEQIVMEG